MHFTDHFLFFPVVVLLGIILIIMSFKLIFRFFLFFLIVFAIWYGLYSLGVVPSPFDIMAEHQTPPPKKPVHVRYPSLQGRL